MREAAPLTHFISRARPPLPRQAYSSAAPDKLAAAATVSDGTNVLRKGTNGWTCMPANPRGMSDPEHGWVDAHEAMPVCFDSAGFAWMTGWMTNTKPVMERDAYVWMLHGDMGEDNTSPKTMHKADAKDPANWVVSGPHLMMFPKDPASIDAFPTDFRVGEPYVMFKGHMFAHLMIPTPGYYDYGTGKAGLAAEPAPQDERMLTWTALARGWGFPVAVIGVAAVLLAKRGRAGAAGSLELA